VEIDSHNKHIYERCLSLLTLQAPVAGDARLLTRILEAIVDLQLIGDYARDIAEVAFGMSAKPASASLDNIEETWTKVGGENIVVLLVNGEVIEFLAGWTGQVNACDLPQRLWEGTAGKRHV
jgi:hypothetical protein